MKERHPWDRQEHETNRAYQAFLCYRDMGALRSLRKAAEIFYGDVGYVSKPSAKNRQFFEWSSNHKWVARCEAWDDEEDRLRTIERRERIKKMDDRQAGYGKTMQKIAYRNMPIVEGLVEDMIKADKTLTVEESRRYIETGVKLERLALGEAGEIAIKKHEGGVKIEYEEVPPEIAKKIGRELARREDEDS